MVHCTAIWSHLESKTAKSDVFLPEILCQVCMSKYLVQKGSDEHQVSRTRDLVACTKGLIIVGTLMFSSAVQERGVVINNSLSELNIISMRFAQTTKPDPFPLQPSHPTHYVMATVRGIITEDYSGEESPKIIN